jgi:leucyl/phenylalanyl-tRNA--protein transferase
MQGAYSELHRLGFAHSAEAWADGRLVGGLYGISLGTAFFGESMFTLRPDASKVAFAVLVRQLARWGVELIDCQMHTPHLERFGAVLWPRRRFLAALERCMHGETRRGAWRLDAPESEETP